MNNNIELSIYEIVGNALCVASSDGQKVHDRIDVALREHRRVTLSFRNVNTLTSAFLNTAIGQLYGNYNEEQIRSLLEVKDMQRNDMELLKRVVDTAKQYFKNPKKFKQAVNDVLGDEDHEE